MRILLERFLTDESGSTAVEYTLIGAGIAIALLTAVNALGGSLGGLFETLDGKIGADAGGGAGG